jgi:hypothetical protein
MLWTLQISHTVQRATRERCDWKLPMMKTRTPSEPDFSEDDHPQDMDFIRQFKENSVVGTRAVPE